MYVQAEKPKDNKNSPIQKKNTNLKQGCGFANNSAVSKHVAQFQNTLSTNVTATAPKLSPMYNILGVVAQFNKDEHGLVPPETHGRSSDFKAPDDPVTTTKGHHHSVPRKQLTRYERMIDRIGRILASNTNVQVAVALDDKTLVLSVNKESDLKDKKLEAVANKLKDIVKGTDPLTEDQRIIGDRRKKDINKTKRLLNGGYTDSEGGIETNEEVREQLERLSTAIKAGVIGRGEYHKGEPGIYVVPTSTDPSEKSYNMHGELKVTGEILDRRKTGKYEEKEVYVGGTLADCFACNASHKVMNEEIKTLPKHNDWRFYSGGTHGGMFMGYRASDEVAKKKARFKTLTGEEVSGGSIPKVDVSGKESPSSMNYDSESEDEDAEKLSEYAKRRSKMIQIKKELKKLNSDVNKIGINIDGTDKLLAALRDELKKLSEEVKSEKYRMELEDAKKQLYEGQLEQQRVQKDVEQKKNEFDSAESKLNEIKKRIMEDKIVVGKKGKGGIKVEFRGDKLGVEGWTTGSSMNEAALKNLDETYGYLKAYKETGLLEKEFKVSSEKVFEIDADVKKLELSLQKANAPVERIEELQLEIQRMETELEKLKVDLENAKKQIVEREEDSLKVKAEGKIEAKKPEVQAVKPRLDWLNKSEISEDEK